LVLTSLFSSCLLTSLDSLGLDAVAFQIRFRRNFGNRAGRVLTPAGIGIVGWRFIAHFEQSEHPTHCNVPELSLSANFSAYKRVSRIIEYSRFNFAIFD